MSDSNSDGVLTGRELFPTLRVIRRHYGDKRCLRRLIKHCDKNKDRKVTVNEWLNCMHSTGKPRPTKWGTKRGYSGAVLMLKYCFN